VKTQYEDWPRKEKAYNGYWYALYRDAHGQPHRVSLKTKNENQANSRYQDLMEQVDRGVLHYSPRPKAMPFSEMVDRYVKEGAGNLKPKSRERHEGCFKLHLVPYFKTQSIKAIGVKDVAAYIRLRQKKGAAPSTIFKELAALSAVFTFLVREEELLQNPVLAVQKPKLRTVRPNYSPTLTEVNLIFEKLNKWARRFFLALCTTGCRLGEIQKANIGDVDFDRGTFRVIRKGGKPQYVPLNREALACIEEEVKFRTDRFGKKPDADEPLFTNRYGRRYKKIRGSLRTACAKAEVPYVTHHSLRHFFANRLKDQKLDIGEISRFLGHANPTVTQNIYLHWRDEALHGRAQDVQILRPRIQKWQKSAKSSK
jgi:integrase/recombinase XerD